MDAEFAPMQRVTNISCTHFSPAKMSKEIIIINKFQEMRV